MPDLQHNIIGTKGFAGLSLRLPGLDFILLRWRGSKKRGRRKRTFKSMDDCCFAYVYW